MRVLVYVPGVFTAINGLFGILFKLNNWPGGGALVTGATLTAVFFVIVYAI